MGHVTSWILLPSSPAVHLTFRVPTWYHSSMSLEATRLDNFVGGINDVDPLIKLKPNECSWNSVEIELFGNQGQLGPRRAYDLFAPSAALPSTTTAANRITSMRTYRNPGGPGDILIWSNVAGIIQKLDPNDSSNTLTTILAAGANAEFDFIQAQDSGTTEYVWCLNGFTAAQKYNVGTSTLSAWAGTPPNGRFHRVWKNMMIISGVAGQPQRLYFSAIANPESWPANNFIDIKSTDDENEEITALEVIGENLLVFKKKSLWLVFDPVSFDNRRIADVGCVGRGAVARSLYGKEEIVFWVSSVGVHSTDGEDVKLESKLIEGRFNDSSLQWGRRFYGFRQFTRLTMLEDGKLYLYNWEAIGFLQFTTVLVCDTKYTREDGQHPWFRHAGVMSGMSAMTPVFYRGHDTNNAEYGGQIAIFDTNAPGGGAQTIGDILVDGLTLDDNANDVIGLYETGWLEVHPITETKERLRRVNVHGDGSVQLTTQADEGSVVVGPTVAFGASRFVRFRPEMRGRFFQLAMSVSLGGRVSQIEMMCRGGKEH